MTELARYQQFLDWINDVLEPEAERLQAHPYVWSARTDSAACPLIKLRSRKIRGTKISIHKQGGKAVKFINESKPAVKYLDYDRSLNAQETHPKA